MSDNVKAAVLVKPGMVEMREFPMPTPKKGAAVAKILLAGICGTDKHSYRGETRQFGGTSSAKDISLPLIQGHENVMVISDIDEEGSRSLEFHGEILKPGDRITMCPDVVCGKCHYCKHFAWYPWCDDMQFCYGNTRSCDEKEHLYGGFAEYIYIEPGTRIYKVPDGLPNEMAVLTELMCVTYTLDKAKEFYSFSGEGFGFNDTVVIQGVGPLGLAHIIKARMLGAGKIIVTDLSDYKLKLAKEFGADIAINVETTTEAERIDLVRQETRGLGADVVVECVGYPHVVNEGLTMLRKAGVYLEAGNFVDVGATPINMHMICSKNLRIVGMYNHAYTGYRPSMEMMLRDIKRFPWDKFISHKFPLKNTEQAIQASMEKDSMKVVIDPWQ
ncbi:MAG: zinc-binding dehydrogenase [Eubacteriales bacterium]|nr:zinc-binding dehydrogenase [Eubacteriales bacterium]